MPSKFVVQSAAGYDHFMGRWSLRLAPLLIDFAGVHEGDHVLDVGCGTGSLTFTLARSVNVSHIDAIDYSQMFVEEAQRRNTNQRISIQQADACALPFPDGRFDRALSLLVLHFVPEAEKAVAEMRRVVRPGGTVAAAVWDLQGGMPNMRMVWDTMVALDPAVVPLRDEAYWRPMTRPNEMRDAWIAAGLNEVEQTSLMIRMEYDSFADFWTPIDAGEGPLGKLVSSLEHRKRVGVERAVRAAYEAGQGDGLRSFATVAWACRGRAPVS